MPAATSKSKTGGSLAWVRIVPIGRRGLGYLRTGASLVRDFVLLFLRRRWSPRDVLGKIWQIPTWLERWWDGRDATVKFSPSVRVRTIAYEDLVRITFASPEELDRPVA